MCPSKNVRELKLCIALDYGCRVGWGIGRFSKLFTTRAHKGDYVRNFQRVLWYPRYGTSAISEKERGRPQPEENVERREKKARERVGEPVKGRGGGRQGRGRHIARALEGCRGGRRQMCIGRWSLITPTPPTTRPRIAFVPVQSVVGCVLRQASMQAQQNKILISGTKHAFWSRKRCGIGCGRLNPRAVL